MRRSYGPPPHTFFREVGCAPHVRQTSISLLCSPMQHHVTTERSTSRPNCSTVIGSANGACRGIKIEGGLKPHYPVNTVCLRCGGEDLVGTRDHTRSRSSRFAMGLTNARSRRQRLRKTTSGSDHSTTSPPLSREDQSLSRFPPRDGRSLNDALAGLQRVPDSKTRATGLRGPLQKRNFLAGLRETYPQITLTAFRPLRNLRPRRLRNRNSRSNCSFDGSCDSQLLLVSF